jgi:drug/metabolite transporter (DMT)-like permease
MTPSARDDSLNGLLRIGAAALIWGTIPLALRLADGASVIKVFYRVLFAGVAVLAWMAATGRLGEITSLPRRKLAQLAGQGALLTVNWVLFLSALDLTTVATAELLGYTGPIFVAALAPFVTGERFDRRIVLPLALALSGIVVILAPQGLALADGRQLLGAVLAFCSALTYAALLLRSKKILRGVSGGALMVVEYTVASALLLPFVVWLYVRGEGPAGVRSYAALAALGLVHTAIAGIIFLSGLRRVRTDHAAVLTYVEPVSAVLFAAAFLPTPEPLTAYTLVGGAMVVGGGLLVARIDAGDVGAGQEAPGLESAAPERRDAAPRPDREV